MRNIKTLFHSSFSGGGGNKMYGEKNARERLDLSQLQNTTTVSTMVTLEDLETISNKKNVIDQEILNSSTSDIINRTKLLDNDIKVMRSESQRLNHEKTVMLERIKDNQEKINNNKQLPYLVGNVVELLNLDADKEASEQGANIDIDAARAGKSAVIKTSTRQTIFLPMIGLVDPSKLKPNDLIGVNKDSYLVLDTLPSEYDSRVKAMEVDEKPTEDYSDIGGLDKQIEELIEAVVLPMKQADKFKTWVSNLQRCFNVWSTWYR